MGPDRVPGDGNTTRSTAMRLCCARGSADMLPPVTVLGFGAVTALGRDAESLTRLLAKPPARPPDSPLAVSDELLVDGRVGRALRRAGRFPRMAVLAAMDAWGAATETGEVGSSCQDVAMDRVGVIVATGLGPHQRTFKFLDGILDCGDESASPTDFSHSVHNAAAAYVTEILGLRGRSCTITDFSAGFEQAVLLAQVWLTEGACDRVVVGVVEELGAVLLHVLPRMFASASISAEVVAGEGACFLTLGPATLKGLADLSATAQPEPVDLLVMDEPVLTSRAGIDITSRSGSILVRRPAGKPVPHTGAGKSVPMTVTFSPYFGHMATSSAFQTLGGLLCLGSGRILGQSLHLAHGADLAETANHTVSVDSVQVYKRSSSGDAPSLLLTRPEF